MLQVSHLAILGVGVFAWVVQFILKLVWLARTYTVDSGWPWLLSLALTADLIVASALVLLVVRALGKNPRNKVQVAAALRKERLRIARELHDQVGSQIVNAMLLFDSPANKNHPLMQTLEQCMLDLRLLVDVMSDYKGNLAEKLGTLRHRLQPVLDKREIKLHWLMEVDSLAHIPTGSRARELSRIVQEAVSNVLQHSMATELTIELRPTEPDSPGEWLLRIIDNGIGIPQSAQDGYEGKGIANMKRRAIRAGSTLRIASDESGTQITVIVDSNDFVPTVFATF